MTRIKQAAAADRGGSRDIDVTLRNWIRLPPGLPAWTRSKSLRGAVDRPLDDLTRDVRSGVSAQMEVATKHAVS